MTTIIWPGSLIFCTLLAAAGQCQAQTITGRVLLSDSSGKLLGDVPGAWVVVCRDNGILKKQDQLLDMARFELVQEADGRAFDVVVGATDMTPATYRGLAADAGRNLVLTVSLQRMSESLRAPSGGRKVLDRRVADALDVLPPNSNEARSIRESLERLERKRTISILVPAYFYPGGDSAREWDEVFWASSQLREEGELVVIVNVQSGPGNPQQPDANYRAVIARLVKSGAKAVGYVHSDYGRRETAEVERDVTAWVKAYPGLSGIFFDTVSSDSKDVKYFKALCEFTRKSLKQAKPPLIIGNAGATCDKSYASDGGFDVICTSEGQWGQGKIEKPEWYGADSPAKLGAIVYGVPDGAALEKAFDRVSSEGFSYVYLSDQMGSANDVLWTRLPAGNEIWRPLVQRTKEWNKAARATK